MSGIFNKCENCEGTGSVDHINDCMWCLGYGDIPDTQENERRAAQDLAHALGQLILWPSTENEDRLADSGLTFIRAVKGHRDPWKR